MQDPAAAARAAVTAAGARRALARTPCTPCCMFLDALQHLNNSATASLPATCTPSTLCCMLRAAAPQLISRCIPAPTLADTLSPCR